jgi:hypothetical protein
MDGKRIKTRYLLATYLVVTALAAISLLLGVLRYPSGSWQQSMLLNLSASMFCVAVLFFLVNRFFLLDEWNMSDRIEKLLNSVEESKSTSAEQFFKPNPALDGYVQGAHQIDWCGVTIEEEIHTNITKIRDSLKTGSIIRILVVDPQSNALEMSALRSQGIRQERFKQKLDATLADMAYLHNCWTSYKSQETGKPIGSLSVRLLPYAPSFGMFSFNKDTNEAVVFIEVYAHADGFGSFPQFGLNPQKDGKWYKFFVSQFEEMWETATPWAPADENVPSPQLDSLVESSNNKSGRLEDPAIK